MNRVITKITAASEMVTVAQKKYEEFAAHKESIEKVRNDIGKKRKNAFELLLKNKKPKHD